MYVSPPDILILTARATLGAGEQPPGTNAGRFVERCQHVTGNEKGAAWCLCFVHMLGDAAFGALWPLPRTASCAALGTWAEKKGVLKTHPIVGDVMLWYSPALHRFAHALIVTTPPDAAGKVGTISGNTTWPGQTGDVREGWCVAEKPWLIRAADRFVRWTELLPPPPK